MEPDKHFSERIHLHKVPTAILGGDLAPDGRTLFASCMDGVYRVDVESGEYEQLDKHNSYASSAAYLPDSNMLVTSGYDGAVQWFDIEKGERVRWLQLHDFWSWEMALSPDKKLLASVTGQYLAGGYRYEPQAESEPSVRVITADSGEILHSFEHVPSVQAVAFSPDSQFVAAGNLMGEVRVWNVQSGEMVANWTTPDFTSWGIVKSHCYLGGIFAMRFTNDGTALLLAGMGPMRDPMAGNGRQLWQKFSWQQDPPEKIDETHKDESGEGLMEALAIHPLGDRFVMGGRLRGGAWNVGLFDSTDGKLLDSLKTDCRVTGAHFTADGKRLILIGTQGQPRKNDGKFPNFGRVDVFELLS